MLYSLQSFQSSLSIHAQKDTLSGLHFSLDRFYFDEDEDNSPEQEKFRFISFKKKFYFDGLNTASSMETDKITQEYLDNRKSIDIQIKLIGVFMEQCLSLREGEELEAEVFGLFDIHTQKNTQLLHNKSVAPLLGSSNIYILKTSQGVSYHIDICGEFTRKDFFQALEANPVLQLLSERLSLESEKMMLEASTPITHLSQTINKPVYKI